MDLWDQRNTLVHRHDKETTAQVRRRDIERKIRVRYVWKGELVPYNRDLLYRTVGRHLENATTTNLVNWYNTNWPVFRASFAESKRQAIAGVATISMFLQRRSKC